MALKNEVEQPLPAKDAIGEFRGQRGVCVRYLQPEPCVQQLGGIGASSGDAAQHVERYLPGGRDSSWARARRQGWTRARSMGR